MQTHLPVGVRHVERNVHVLVDTGGQDVPAVFLVETRQIGAPSAQGDAEGRSRDDHRSRTLRRRRLGRLAARQRPVRAEGSPPSRRYSTATCEEALKCGEEARPCEFWYWPP